MEARQLLYTIEEFEQYADAPENRDRLLEPQKRFVEVYSLDDEALLLKSEILDGGAVLPEFQMPVSAIFEDTAAE